MNQSCTCEWLGVHISSQHFYEHTSIKMLNMKTIGIVLAISSLASTFDWNGLRVKWKSKTEDSCRISSLFEIPLTLHQAKSAGWVQVPDVDHPKVTVHCIPDDYRFCVLLDKCGNVAGFQAGVSVNDLAPMQKIYNLSNIHEYEVKMMFDEEIWTTSIYTVDPHKIEACGCHENDGLTGTEGIWIKNKHGWLPIPRYVEDLDPIWLKQVCINEMGTHYFYNMSTSFPCEKTLPWFLLYKDGEMNGCGFEGFGKPSIKDREWWEELGVPITYVIPDSPQCLSDWIEDYGLIFMHVFFEKEPWKFSCKS